MNTIDFASSIWLHPGHAGWHFISVPPRVTQQIKKRYGHLAAGWGSLRVQATVGGVSWQTSIFPDTKMKVYLLPVKASARKQAAITAGQKVRVELKILAT